MTPLDAVAAAIRERLLAGRPAPLPGLGTLVRQHVASRIQERADGTRVLMPPGETIGLASASAAGHESLAVAFGRFLNIDGAQAVQAYRDAMDQVEARLAVTGEVRLPGVGLLRRTSGGVILGVEADLLAVVNRTYEGLAPVGAVPSAPPSPPPPPPAPPRPPVPPEVEVTRVRDLDPMAFEPRAPGETAVEADDDSAADQPPSEIPAEQPEAPGVATAESGPPLATEALPPEHATADAFPDAAGFNALDEAEPAFRLAGRGRPASGPVLRARRPAVRAAGLLATGRVRRVCGSR